MTTTKLHSLRLTIAAIISFILPALLSLKAQGTAFTYQGRLTLGSATASGNWDLQFKLYDAPTDGGQVGSTLSIVPVVANSGLFTVTLDFGGGAFNGSGRWIEVGARTNGSTFGYTNLFPRVAVLPAPYAINAGNGVPVGSVMAFMGTNPPPGWLLCDGRAISRTNFAALFMVMGTASGAGDGATTFNLPDLRGMFLRGFNGGRTGSWSDQDAASRIEQSPGGNTGDNIGSIQKSQTGDHTHGGDTGVNNGSLTAQIHVNASGNIHGRHRTITSWNGNDYGADATALSLETGAVRGAVVVGATSVNNANSTQAYPINTFVNYIIKY